MLLDPHHLLTEARRALRDHAECGSPKARELVLALQGAPVRDGLAYALDKHATGDHRHYIESMMLAGGTNHLIQAATEMPMAAVIAYAEFLFDDSVFRDRLDRLAYVKQISSSKDIDRDSFKLYQSALVIGPDVVAWRLNSNMSGVLNPVAIIRRCLGDAMFRGLSHRLMPNVELTKDHVAWLKHTKELAVELNKLDPADARDAEDALRVALRHEDRTVNASSSGIPQDKILH